MVFFPLMKTAFPNMHENGVNHDDHDDYDDSANHDDSAGHADNSLDLYYAKLSTLI